MPTYGKTWWGKKWLETFNDIDDDNRLPRGRTYANTGRAHSIKVKNNTVTAKVNGSRATPYKVKITFNEFDQDIQATLRGLVIDSPLILSSLLNKKLPTQIISHLDKEKIKLFPSRWGDIDAYCSCPDWAMPCKHIASVIYLLCAKIDQNPFTLFELHSCDLLKLIEDCCDGSITNTQKIDTIDKILKTPKKSANTPDPCLDIDLSSIPNLLTCIGTILEDNPPFYDKNFRDVLVSACKYWQKQAHIPKIYEDTKTKLSEEEKFLKKWPAQLTDVQLTIDNEHNIQFMCRESDTVLGQKKDNIHYVINFLDALPNTLLHKFCSKVRFLHMVYQYTVVLLERSAIMPQILENKRGMVQIRWIPALFDEKVNRIYQTLSESCPQDLIVYNGQTIPIYERVKTIISWMISRLIYANLPSALLKKRTSDIFQLFFDGQKIDFKNFTNTETPRSIHQWLSKLYLKERQHKLYLTIEEATDNFNLTAQILLPKASLPINIKKALKTNNSKLRFEILSDLSLVSDYLPEFDTLLEQSICMTLDDFAPLFLRVLPVLQAIGVVVVLPKSLHKILKPKINLSLQSTEDSANDRTNFLSLQNILSFNWRVAIGDQSMSIADLKKILHASGDLVKIRDQYVMLDEKDIAKLLKQMEKLPESLPNEYLLQAMLGEEIDGAVVTIDSNLKQLVKSFNKPQPLPVPSNLRACLRPYQEQGFNWLLQNIQASFGSILADDMGLGKTIQVIAVVLHLKNSAFLKTDERVLVVAPTGLLSNWQKEFEKFAPDINVCLYYGQKRELLADCDVVLTSYGLARRDKTDLNKKRWYLLVIDEAQNIKNPYAAQTKAIKSIKATHKIAMSGTPVENRLLEYWSIFDFTNKLYLGTIKQFNNRYASPIEKKRDVSCLDCFKKITAPFMLRRLKSDKNIIADLPEKIENNCYCQLTPNQTALYQKVVDSSLKKIEQSEGIERKGLVLQLINALKQICNHPSQFLKQQGSVDQSGKMTMLQDIIAEIENTGEKCLIFTQYVEMGNLLVNLLSDKMTIPFLHGGISRSARDNMVNDFQDPLSNTRFFIISLKAGGTGLNLTAASHVIHYDLWWNPAVENQATDRTYRIGQKRNVMVHRFITTSTFEERIDDMIKSKKELANLTVNSGENWITDMTTTEIKTLVDLRHIDPAQPHEKVVE